MVRIRIDSTFSRKIHEVDVAADESIENLENLIYTLEGLYRSQYRIVFQGHELTIHNLLSDYRIRDEETIHLVPPKVLKIGGNPELYLADIRNSSIGKSCVSCMIKF
jgi:hypothetical protein